ncbi:Eukaryotic translation initiation factor 3 subunit J like [Actinidia chinensis var. chinensis]|uniref:Eukaryotic translation initiation factor 3 subunit J like n=1 Tax=Actinidia chinensis var. chinensis TaxID=1590841 RepID=A0A2R6QWB2_ACTCC|nr:Eukaryotic translation initiation factor 3 subunit J like [Actinidia chinensis var. chinensis]
MPSRQKPIQDVMKNKRIVRLQQLVENLADKGEEDDVKSNEEENPFAERQPERQAGGQPRYHCRVEGQEAITVSNQWETGLKIDIPEFHGELKAEDFLDWLFAIEKVLEFKEVPENKRVPLVATYFRGRAAAWWQQLKVNRAWMGKRKIESWDRLKKHLREAFLPHNYARVMYQRFQNLRQGTRIVDEYTTEFYQLMARNDLGEIDDQLVSRCYSLRGKQSGVLVFCPGLDLVVRVWPNKILSEVEAQLGVAGKPPTLNPVKPVASIAGRCFKCGEPGHRFADCKKSAVQKGLFIDNEWMVRVELEQPLEDLVDEQADEEFMEEEHVTGDDGPLLVVRRACLTPRETSGDGWLRNNIFQSKCTVGGEICKFVIDFGSCENVISEEAIRKLGFATKKHNLPK